jgi:polyribonucleotide nucleotidyltransferase
MCGALAETDGGHSLQMLILETGEVGRQANGAIMASMGETVSAEIEM